VSQKKSKTRILFLNLLLLMMSLLFLFLLLEFIVFRFILPASDYPYLATAQEVVKYKPDQSGTYRVRFEIESPFRINSQGWNSARSEYRIIKGKRRIAVIGDSYVEAFQVPYNKSFSELLDEEMGEDWEVFRFGISGAPLSHYLWMLEKEVVSYKPDIVILNLVHNDFSESWQAQGGEYSSSFMKFVINSEGGIKSRPPTPYSPSRFSFVRQMAWYRFLAYRFQVSPGALVRKLLNREAVAVANVNLEDLKQSRLNNRLVFSHSLKILKELEKVHGFQTVLQIDGVRDLIEGIAGNEESEEVLKLNDLVVEECSSLQMNCLDLHPVFEEHFRKGNKSFQFEHDGHWNELSHQIVANELKRQIMEMAGKN